MNILVTGGAGYIGSHTCVELLNAGYDVIVCDNLSNSKYEAIKRVEEICDKKIKFYNNDVRDKTALTNIFSENNISAVIHFAGLKAVGESVKIPIRYYDNNINSTLVLCDVMSRFNVKKIVFSSSATVYGDADVVPVTEASPLSATNPYGRTKLFLEYILDDLYTSDNEWSISKLRYFNPVGAHESGKIGEDPCGIPNNLMPYISQVATKKIEFLNIYGNDYDTKDGTGVRDYIHVVDLAIGHLKAIDYILNKNGVFTHNLGTGIGYSVLDVVNTFSRVNNIEIPYKFADRRSGDVATLYSDCTKALNELSFKTTYNLENMCRSSYNFQKNNPTGYCD